MWSLLPTQSVNGSAGIHAATYVIEPGGVPLVKVRGGQKGLRDPPRLGGVDGIAVTGASGALGNELEHGADGNPSSAALGADPGFADHIRNDRRSGACVTINPQQERGRASRDVWRGQDDRFTQNELHGWKFSSTADRASCPQPNSKVVRTFEVARRETHATRAPAVRVSGGFAGQPTSANTAVAPSPRARQVWRRQNGGSSFAARTAASRSRFHRWAYGFSPAIRAPRGACSKSSATATTSSRSNPSRTSSHMSASGTP